MSFWSGATLKERIPRLSIIDPFNPAQIDCAAYQLKMGKEVYVTPDYQVSRLSSHTKILLSEDQDFTIPPGQFAFLLTEERIRIPENVLGFISLRTTYKFKGLINVSGFHVDPGFEGHLIYAVYNAGPTQIHLARGMQLFLIWFAELDRVDHEFVRNQPPLVNISPDLITNIPGEILTLQSLSQEIRKLRDTWFHIRVYGGGFLVLLSILGTTFAVIRFWSSFASLFAS